MDFHGPSWSVKHVKEEKNMLSADIIITNARIFTSDNTNPHAEAVAVKGNRILYVGTDLGVEIFRGKSTRVIDGGGRTLTAGFIDSYVHLLSGSIWMGTAQLRDVKTIEELSLVLMKFADENKTDAWIVGRGIRYNIVSTCQELDQINADRPILSRCPMQTASANY